MGAIAIVTGASSGLGREFVHLLDAGAFEGIDEIWAVARRADRLDALARTTSLPVRPFCLDLCDPMSFDLIEGALAETPGARVRLVINNAGFGTFGSFREAGRTDASRICALLVTAPVELMYRTLPYMSAGSRIINIASVAAFTPQPGLAAYSAAKRFLLDLSRSLDAELAGVDLPITAVCPKFMKTEFLDAPGDVEVARRMTAIGFEQPGRVAARALAASRAGASLCIPSLDMKAYYAASRVLPYKVMLGLERLVGAL